MIKDVHINNPKPLLKGDGFPNRDGTFARGLREHRHFEGTVVAWRSPSRVVGASVLYHFLVGLASPQQVSGSLVGDGDHSLKCPTAYTLGRFPVRRVNLVQLQIRRQTLEDSGGGSTRGLEYAPRT